MSSSVTSGSPFIFSEILKHVPDAVLLMDVTANIEQWLGRAEQILGYTASEAVGRNLSFVLRPDVRQQTLQAILREVEATGAYHGEIACLRKDGCQVPIEVSARFLSGWDGRPHHLLLFGRDVRHLWRESSRNAAEAAQLALEAGRMGVWDWNIQTGELDWSKSLERMHGLSPGAFAGTFEAFLACIHPEDRAATRFAMERALRQRSHYEREFRVVWPDGSIHWIAGKGQVYCDQAGNPVRMIGLGLDVTERKALEEKLRESQKLESVGLLAGGIAHDFNNLLTGILGNASLAMDMIPAASPAQTLLNDLVAAGEKAAGLTQQLLAYSGKGSFVIQSVDLSALARNMTGLMHVSLPKSVQLRLELAPGLPMMEGDPSQLQQVVMNLVSNAAEAIGENAGTIVLRTSLRQIDNAHIRQFSAPAEIGPGNYVSLEVQDTGCGMDPETQARVFDPFFTTKFTGRGLGLAAVAGIVRGHRGAIRVVSAPGSGSTFTVLFPIAEQPRLQREEIPRPASASGTILVVDDEEVVRRTAEMALRRYGYTVLLAENGLEGLERFRSQCHEIALVLLDMTMPVMSGDEAVRHIRAIRADVPVIASTGYSELEASQRFEGSGLAGFIQKPYTVHQLAEKVCAALAAARHAAP